MLIALWHSRTSRKLQTTTMSTSRKRHGTTSVFILKRIEDSAARRCDKRTPNAEPGSIGWRAGRRYIGEVMPRDKSIRSGWRCDSCGELVPDVQAGWVEWLAAEEVKGKPKVSGLRLVHSRNASPRWQAPSGCQYNPRDEFRKNRGI